MYLQAISVRFFKSFNFDFLRKNHPKASPYPWEKIDGAWFPFVKVPLCRDITTIVGANESGKSHLLGAITKGLSGRGITRRDFCRYSPFFTVEQGKIRKPDFGFHFAEVDEEKAAVLQQMLDPVPAQSFSQFVLIRSEENDLAVWIPSGDDKSYSKHQIKDAAVLGESTFLPAIFEIDSRIALPESVPISWLCGATKQPWARQYRTLAVQAVDAHLAELGSEEGLKKNAATIAKAFLDLKPRREGNGNNDPALAEEIPSVDLKTKRWELAHDLLFKIAKIDETSIRDLQDALNQCNEGLVNALLQQMNERLGAALNFPKWWVQDRDFRLVVSARDDDLVFTIRDRTRTEYSFRERSNGLKYFLSYYIQHLAHESPKDRDEILLMDEPDAFLSSQGQQDLLKIFDNFASPEPNSIRHPVQVIYVTHSPFLIDRNHGERIRVLEKGIDDEGTRVVNDASKNHYEPLRSSFGAFVGETTFIGNCNVMVEGLADQVLLAGSSAYLRMKGVAQAGVLDMNRITVVPAGSAGHIPYLVYLARGRDIEQPSVIVLLDSDKAGNEQIPRLKKGPDGRPLLDSDYVLQIGVLALETKLPDGKQLIESEDLIPTGIAARAAQHYLETFCRLTTEATQVVTGPEILSAWTEQRTLFDAVNYVAASKLGSETHIDKLGFARCLFEVLRRSQEKDATISIPAEEVATFVANFRALHGKLTLMQRKAERETVEERLARRVERMIKSFLQDHPNGCRHEEAAILLEDLDAILVDSKEADDFRYAMKGIRREFGIAELKPDPLVQYDRFKDALGQLRYAAKIATQVET